MKEAKSNYDIAIKELVYRPGESALELITLQTVTKVNQFFSNISKDVKKKFKNKKLIQILEFPVLFLGAKPSDTPSFYSFMNYADFGLGTWQPKDGMYSVILGIEKLAKELGVVIETNSAVEKIIVTNKKATAIIINGNKIDADIVLTGADYHHSETLLDLEYRQYSEKYWESKTFAPSSLLFYVGFNKKLKNVVHHNLFFDVDFDIHASDIYDNPKWPENPLFYASFPSKTDDNAAPEGKEAAIFLIPLAPGIEDARSQLAETQKLVNEAKIELGIVIEDLDLIQKELLSDEQDAKKYKNNHTHKLPRAVTDTAKRKSEGGVSGKKTKPTYGAELTEFLNEDGTVKKVKFWKRIFRRKGGKKK
jgi:phytoene desaturase